MLHQGSVKKNLGSGGWFPGQVLGCCLHTRVGRTVRPNSGDTYMCELRKALAALLLIVVASLLLPFAAPAADDTPLTKEQIKPILQTAEVIKSKQTGKGVTHPWRLTLSNGAITHDASFQAIDVHKAEMKLESGRSEIDFNDSYRFNIAAYELAELVGLGDMLPVYVERKWQVKSGSISWWLPVKMDEAERVEKKIEVTDCDKCDRELLEKLKALNAAELSEKTKRYLNKDEVNAVMARRDKIVATFQTLIAQKGEKEVLY